MFTALVAVNTANHGSSKLPVARGRDDYCREDHRDDDVEWMEPELQVDEPVDPAGI